MRAIKFHSLFYVIVITYPFHNPDAGLGIYMRHKAEKSQTWLTLVARKFIKTEWRTYASIKDNSIDSNNGLSPGLCQAIIWTNAGIFLIGLWGTNFSEILVEIYSFSFKKMHLKMSSGKLRPFSLGLNVLTKIKYISIFYNFSTLLRSFFAEGKTPSLLLSQNHGCWWTQN